MAETLPTLPDAQFVDTDAQVVVNSVLEGYELAAARKLADGDPVRLFLLSLAYTIAMQRAQIDAAGKSNLLYYAQGAFLDHLGASRRVQRIPAQAAVTTLRFMMGAVLSYPVLIPAGTRATADNEIFFQTTEAVEVPAGAFQVTVRAEAMTAGVVGNRYQSGQIVSLVDPIAYVAGVTNTEDAQGGREQEDDEALRMRIYQAPASFSTAGPSEAYAYWAYTASSAIVDVAVVSPSPAVVHVYPLLAGGEIPGQATLDAVADILNGDTLRPLADRVQVLTPEAVPYDLEVTWYMPKSRQADAAQIQGNVEQAVQAWVAWQCAKLGRDINPDALTERLRAAGAKRAVIASPAFEALDAHQVAKVVELVINYGGVEDE